MRSVFFWKKRVKSVANCVLGNVALLHVLFTFTWACGPHQFLKKISPNRRTISKKGHEIHESSFKLSISRWDLEVQHGSPEKLGPFENQKSAGVPAVKLLGGCSFQGAFLMSQELMRNQSPDEKLSGLAFKVAADPYIGTLTFYRWLVAFCYSETGGWWWFFVEDVFFFWIFSSRKLGCFMMQFDEVIFFSDGLVQAPISYGLLWENGGTKTPEKWWLKRQPGKKGAWICLRDWREGMKFWYICVCLWYGPVPFWYSLWYMVGDGFRYLHLFREWQKVCYPQVSFHLTASVILTNQEMVDNYNNIPFLRSWMRKLTLGRTHILVQELKIHCTTPKLTVDRPRWFEKWHIWKHLLLKIIIYFSYYRKSSILWNSVPVLSAVTCSKSILHVIRMNLTAVDTNAQERRFRISTGWILWNDRHAR